MTLADSIYWASFGANLLFGIYLYALESQYNSELKQALPGEDHTLRYFAGAFWCWAAIALLEYFLASPAGSSWMRHAELALSVVNSSLIICAAASFNQYGPLPGWFGRLIAFVRKEMFRTLVTGSIFLIFILLCAAIAGYPAVAEFTNFGVSMTACLFVWVSFSFAAGSRFHRQGSRWANRMSFMVMPSLVLLLLLLFQVLSLPVTGIFAGNAPMLFFLGFIIKIFFIIYIILNLMNSRAIRDQRELHRDNERLKRLSHELYISIGETHHRSKNRLHTLDFLLSDALKATDPQDTRTRALLAGMLTSVGAMGVVEQAILEKHIRAGETQADQAEIRRIPLKAALEALIPAIRLEINLIQPGGDLPETFLHILTPDDPPLIHSVRLGKLIELLVELCRNSAKYGDKSRLHLALSQENGQDLVLCKYDGSRWHPEDFSGGFGTLLLDAFQRQLGATVAYQDDPAKGTVQTIRIPAASLH